MKSLKIKITKILSAFAIASFTLFAAFTFIGGARVFADVSAPTDEQFVMENGAYVRNAEDLGISFVTKVNKTWYEEVIASGATVSFGTIVTNTPTDGSDITFNSENVKDIPSTKFATNGNTELTYRGSIIYNNLTEDELLLAPLVKLTGRGYVKITANEVTTIYYAKAGDNSRSMRDVAIAAAESGNSIEGIDTYTKVKTLSYAEGLNFIEKASASNTFTPEEFTADSGSLKAFVGANEISVGYADGAITLNTEALPEALVLGKNYNLTVIANADNTSAFSARVKFVTKALKTKDDLDVFDITTQKVRDAFTKDDDAVAGDTVEMVADANNTYFVDGYYYLANDIDATGKYIRQYGMTNSGETIDNIKYTKYNKNGDTTDVNEGSKYIGFKGTLEGAGHTISGLHLGRSGLFGNVLAGAKIKNVALTDITLDGQGADRGGNVLACHIHSSNLNTTELENLYIQVKDDQYSKGILAFDYRGQNSAFVMKNIIIDCPNINDSGKNQGGSLFINVNTLTANKSLVESAFNKNASNVYVISNYELAKYTFTLYGGNEGKSSANNYVFEHIKRYTTAEEMKNANNDYSSFTESGYWTIGDNGIPQLKKN